MLSKEVPVARLYRLAAWSGVLSAVVLVINAFRKANVIPNTGLTHGIAPLAEALGLLALTGLFLQPRVRVGMVGLIGYGINFIGLAGVLGAEVLINLVFPTVGTEQTTALLHGPTGTVLTIASLLYLVGSVVFGAALWMAGEMPRIAIVAYSVGSAASALRGQLPSFTLIPGLLVLAAGVIWLCASLAGQWPIRPARHEAREPSALAKP
jgi:hypothetical protein